MDRRWVMSAAAVVLLLALSVGQVEGAAKQQQQQESWSGLYDKLVGRTSTRVSSPDFCVVVRTYWGHGQRAGDGGLRRLLRSLQRQSVHSWEAVLLVLDSRPFEDLHHILEDFQDDRIWVFAEWIDQQFKPKEGVEWAPGYHGTLYNLTDDAIQVCPPGTKWLVVTNGDNEYAEDFMQRVAEAGTDADLVAVDFYSRYQRPTAPSCERFAAAPGAPACKTNRLRWCHTDLGANVVSYQRFLAEGRRFGGLGGVSGGLGAEHFDGIMMQLLMAASWRVKHLEGYCPFNHAPSFQSCGWTGGVWDDRDIVSWASAGGKCISPEEAAQVLAADPEAEEVTIAASSDGNVTAFEGVRPEQLAVRCLRKKQYMSDQVLGSAVEWFNALCVDDTDLPAFREWQRWQQELDAAAAAAGGEGGGEGGGGGRTSDGSGDVAAQAQAAAAAAAAKQQGGSTQEPDDFWALQQEFYKAPAAAAAGDAAGAAAVAGGAGDAGGQQQAAEQQPGEAAAAAAR